MTQILLRGKPLRTVAPGGILQVQRQVSRVNEEVVKAPLKTKNSYRTISLGVNAVGILKEQRKKCGSSEYVFPSPTGGLISPDDEWLLSGALRF